jgi:hypothetical protein
MGTALKVLQFLLPLYGKNKYPTKRSMQIHLLDFFCKFGIAKLERKEEGFLFALAWSH